MEQTMNDVRGNRSLFNVVPVGDNILIEMEYTKSSIEVEEALKTIKHLRVAGVGNNVKEYEIGDLVYFRVPPRDAGRVNVIKPNENCRYIMVTKFDIDGVFTEMTPAAESKKKLDIVAPTAADMQKIVNGK